MYSSLDKIDIVAERDGVKIAVQTDHRTQDEIDERFELSVVFAITRAVNPLLMSEDFQSVRFVMASKPSPRFIEVLTLAGADVEEDDGTTHNAALDESKRLKLARRALRSIGSEALERHGVGPDRDGLVSLQTAVLKQIEAAGGSENETEYWTHLVELGAATGVVLEEMFGGDWEIPTEFYSVVPFVFESKSGEESLTINAFGKVERFTQEGESEAPSNLITMMQQTKMAHGTEPRVMFSFRTRDWAGADSAVCEPLLTGNNQPDADIPLVALIHDLPEATRTIPSDTSDEEVKALMAEALESLKQMKVEIEQIEGELPTLIVHGGYYAGEKILDTEFMFELQKRLKTEAVMVAIPTKGVAFVTSAMCTQEQMGGFCMLAREQYKNAPSNERVSSGVFMFLEGKPVAFAAPGQDDEANAE